MDINDYADAPGMVRGVEVTLPCFSVTYTVYEDNYIILEASASAAVEVDVDLLFDRFRWAELSLGFASTGGSLDEEVSSGLWELNDVTRHMNKELQAIQVHVNVRSAEGRLPLRQLFAVWDLALPVAIISNLRSVAMKRISRPGISPVQRNPFPDFYSRDCLEDVAKESWASAVALVDHVVVRHRTPEQGTIALKVGGEKTKEATFYAEGFRPVIISRDFESILGDLPLEEEWSVAAIRI